MDFGDFPSGSKLGVFHLQYSGVGEGAIGHFSLTWRSVWSSLFKGLFGALPWRCSPHFVVPGETGKSYGSSQNLISSSHVGFFFSWYLQFHKTNRCEKFIKITNSLTCCSKIIKVPHNTIHLFWKFMYLYYWNIFNIIPCSLIFLHFFKGIEHRDKWIWT